MTREQLLEIKSVDALVDKILTMYEESEDDVLQDRSVDFEKDYKYLNDTINQIKQRYQELKLEDTSSFEAQICIALDTKQKFMFKGK